VKNFAMGADDLVFIVDLRLFPQGACSPIGYKNYSSKGET